MFKITKVKLIGDLHIGSKFSRIDLIKKALYGDDPIILMGDLGDFINPKDPRFDTDCIMTIDEQLTCLLKLLKKKNILGLIDGNHELSLERYSGININKVLSSQLNIPHLGPNAYITIDNIVFYVYHGTGGGAFKGTILQKLEKVPIHRGAHVYTQGHSHQLFTVPTAVEIGGKRETNWLINSGSFMDDASYARSKNLPPSVLGYAIYDTELDYAYPVLLGNERELTNVHTLTKDNLIEYYKTHSLKETVDYFDVSERTIMRRVKDFGISKRQK